MNRSLSLTLHIPWTLLWEKKPLNFYIDHSQFSSPTLPAAYLPCPTDVMVARGNPKCPAEAGEGGGKKYGLDKVGTSEVRKAQPN